MFPMIPRRDEMESCVLQFRRFASQDEEEDGGVLLETSARVARSDCFFPFYNISLRFSILLFLPYSFLSFLFFFVLIHDYRESRFVSRV